MNTYGQKPLYLRALLTLQKLFKQKKGYKCLCMGQGQVKSVNKLLRGA